MNYTIPFFLGNQAEPIPKYTCKKIGSTEAFLCNLIDSPDLQNIQLLKFQTPAGCNPENRAALYLKGKAPGLLKSVKEEKLPSLSEKVSWLAVTAKLYGGKVVGFDSGQFVEICAVEDKRKDYIYVAIRFPVLSGEYHARYH